MKDRNGKFSVEGVLALVLFGWLRKGSVGSRLPDGTPCR